MPCQLLSIPLCECVHHDWLRIHRDVRNLSQSLFRWSVETVAVPLIHQNQYQLRRHVSDKNTERERIPEVGFWVAAPR